MEAWAEFKLEMYTASRSDTSWACQHVALVAIHKSVASLQYRQHFSLMWGGKMRPELWADLLTDSLPCSRFLTIYSGSWNSCLTSSNLELSSTMGLADSVIGVVEWNLGQSNQSPIGTPERRQPLRRLQEFVVEAPIECTPVTLSLPLSFSIPLCVRNVTRNVQCVEFVVGDVNELKLHK